MSRSVLCLLVVLALAVFAGGLQAQEEPGKAAEAQKATGKIKSVKAEEMQFVITDKGGKEMTFQLNARSRISLADKPGERATLKDLKPGDEVEVSYTKLGTRNVATEVRTKKKDDTP